MLLWCDGHTYPNKARQSSPEVPVWKHIFPCRSFNTSIVQYPTNDIHEHSTKKSEQKMHALYTIITNCW